MMKKNIQVDQGTMEATIDCSKNAIYVVKDGCLIMIEPPSSGYGEQTAIWLGGKVDRVECTEINKVY
ncbi:DUF3954 domain-containing protein [Halalkalibacterium halodurans]|uniref:DUF3954 domain-containing protein n=1 Tax=Halalkalibacterium halodurans TaxID=86665 RepID=UPI00399C7C87